MSLLTHSKFWMFDHTRPLVWSLLLSLCAGAFTVLGFAPFHLPGAAILSMAVLYTQLQRSSIQQAFAMGIAFGLGFMSVGVSWVTVSIHDYGHLNIVVSIGITALLIVYLSIFTGLCACFYRYLAIAQASLLNAVLFSSLWCLSEYVRANCLSGFPWLLLGFGQIDTPFQYVLPLIGIYGCSFLAVFAATLLSHTMQPMRFQLLWLIAFVLLMLSPNCLRQMDWTMLSKQPVSVGVIQANLSMRDKWNEAIFWRIMHYYQKHIESLLGDKQVIVLPESAVPLPASYVQSFLDDLHHRAKKSGTALIVGMPEETDATQVDFYNTMHALGSGAGSYRKQHLVPFGEYIPGSITSLMNWLALPLSNMKAGSGQQSLINIHHQPIASLICYELAYPQLLRHQLPKGQWIVSVSDDGWFGHSFAIYQQQQMAQALSIISGRYQIVANNDGLSSIINHHGVIKSSLPAYRSGVLEGEIYASEGATPWVRWGDMPILLLCCCILVLCSYKKLCNSSRRSS